ncbi:hypothetical protein [Acidocella sp.]|uniref:hypothetical protein n=1 Tax=Acidocella sp. TaxID=50710 RepID=UPI00260F1E37|nr:hypothetical protein [Acidocella sp.]
MSRITAALVVLSLAGFGMAHAQTSSSMSNAMGNVSGTAMSGGGAMGQDSAMGNSAKPSTASAMGNSKANTMGNGASTGMSHNSMSNSQ